MNETEILKIYTSLIEGGLTPSNETELINHFMQKLFLPFITSTYIKFNRSVDLHLFNELVLIDSNIIIPEFNHYFNNLNLANVYYCRLICLSLKGLVHFPSDTERGLVFRFFRYPNSFTGNLLVAEDSINKYNFNLEEKIKLLETLGCMRKNSIWISEILGRCRLESSNLSFDINNTRLYAVVPLKFNEYMQELDSIPLVKVISYLN